MSIKSSLLIASFCLLSSAALAQQTPATEVKEPVETISIPVLSDGQVFSKLDDKYPAVLTYFTSSSYDEVTEFYSEQYGAPVDEQTQYGRLELEYIHMDHPIRVIVDDQKTKREVNVIVQDVAKVEE
ncbi:hypothetical protein [Thalassomonas sp. M1454]|uniref:hypothetical protein n=1 Tax=Thalassomonas sp. M1454 TaxID=2594477 RepID=UPI001180807E|nr:hypothetical protein [Thalassomonas sp. M1454]TRX56435.1 hypothetical protein FNN08_02580 [Thalassomonas sp. M1454]